MDTRLASDGSEGPGRCPRKRDPEIHQDVRAELALQQDDARRSVEISVHQGVVSLSGLVESYAQKWAIDRAVRRIVGVRGLHDCLHVRPSEAVAPGDRQLERAANRALRWDARVPAGLRAHARAGVVRLSGAVAWSRQREAAEEAVRNLMGVRDLVNEIVLLPAALPADLPGKVEAVLERRLGVAARAISVAAEQGVVTLRGLVPTVAMLGLVERAAWSIPGITRVHNQLRVE